MLVLSLLVLSINPSAALATGPQKTSLLREGRRIEVLGGIDFSQAEYDEEAGKRCILKEMELDTLTRDPVLQCTHK